MITVPSIRPPIVTQVRKTGPYDRPWVLLWQTATMAAPAFWYYKTREQAINEQHTLHRQHAPKHCTLDPNSCQVGFCGFPKCLNTKEW